MRIVSRWPCIPTLPTSTDAAVFLRRTLTTDARRPVWSLEDCFASLSAILLWVLSLWALTHLISTGLPVRAASLTNCFQSGVLGTGLPSLVIQPVWGQVKRALS